jgi:hypothetical protein
MRHPSCFRKNHILTCNFALKSLGPRRCLREISAVSALPAHPNIVGQYRAWQEGGHFYIQMDLCEGGSLHQMIATVRGLCPSAFFFALHVALLGPQLIWMRSWGRLAAPDDVAVRLWPCSWFYQFVLSVNDRYQ